MSENTTDPKSQLIDNLEELTRAELPANAAQIVARRRTQRSEYQRLNIPTH